MAFNNLPLVLLNGLLCDQRLWHHQISVFERSREVCIPDLSQDASIEGMAKRVLSEAPAHFALAALSMGGYVALEILRQAPARVSKLALIDTMARADSDARAKSRRGLLALAQMGKFKGVTRSYCPDSCTPAV